jgi:hypothetical protein
VSYLIREQFYNFTPRKHTVEDSLPKKIEFSFYILCLKEFNLDSLLYKYLWNPVKWAGNQLNFLTTRIAILFFIPVYALGLAGLYWEESIPDTIHAGLPFLFSLLGLFMVLKAFTERIHARLSWVLIILNHCLVALAILYNEHFDYSEAFLYLSGILVAGMIGYFSLRRLKFLEGSIDLDQFHGHSHRHPKIAIVFLIACLGASGFPITPTFIGEDLIFSHIHEDQIVLAFFTSLSFIIDGLAIMRIYARVFLGPHAKSVYEMAYRSS